MKDNVQKTILGIAEYGPLLFFFLGYIYGDIISATIALMISSPIGIGVIWFLKRKIAWMPLTSGVLVVFFGSLTVLLDDPIFIKIKPTIVECLFSAAMFISLRLNKPAAQLLFANKIKLPDLAWRKVTRDFGFFFLFLAILNEIIWRSMSTDFWVYFKIFGLLGLTIIFTFVQILKISPFLKLDDKS